jgi:serine/threonine-protein kinase
VIELPATLAGGEQLIMHLGHGGMGDVYLAILRGPAGVKKLQVMKLLLPEYAEDAELTAMFLDEGRLATRLNHPNIVQTNAVLEEGSRYFLQMEYLEGQSLYALERRGPIPLALSLRILSEVLAALDYAHELRDYDGTPLHIVHRDVAPQNVFILYDGHTKLVDFGIARSIQRSVQTSEQVMRGRLSFTSPEYARGDRAVDHRADLFAVGVMLFQAVAGASPWKGRTDFQILVCLQRGEIPGILDVKPDTPAWLAEILTRALAVDPDQRYATAREMQADLERGMDANGLRASARDLGSFVSTSFTDERAERRTQLEDRLRRFDSGVGPAISRDRLRDARSSPSNDVEVDDDDTSAPRASHHDGDGSLTAASRRATPRARRSVRRAWLPIAAACMAWGAVIASFAFFPTRQKPAAPVLTAAESAVAAAPVEITIASTAPGARLYLDDAILAANPFVGTFLPSPISRRVRAEAPGYTSKEMVVTFAQPLRLEIALEPLRPDAAVVDASRTPAAAPRAVPARPPPRSSDPQGARPPFDPTDPWR